MDRVHYAGASIVTGTALARALLDYAQALAQVGASATVRIPTLRADGSPGLSEILIGPASQLFSETESSADDDVVDTALVGRMREEAENLRQHGVPAPKAAVVPPEEPDWTEYEY